MLQEEFETIAKRKVTPEQYKKIEDVYNYCPSLSKQEFCEDWNQHQSSKIIADLTKYVLLLDSEKRKLIRIQNIFMWLISRLEPTFKELKDKLQTERELKNLTT